MKRSLPPSLSSLSSTKKLKPTIEKKTPTPEQIVFSSPDLVEHILSFVPLGPKKCSPRYLFRSFRLVNKTFYSSIPSNMIEPLINDFVYLDAYKQTYRIPSNLPLVKSGKKSLKGIRSKFVKSYILDVVMRINEKNQSLFSNIGSYVCFMYNQSTSLLDWGSSVNSTLVSKTISEIYDIENDIPLIQSLITKNTELALFSIKRIKNPDPKVFANFIRDLLNNQNVYKEVAVRNVIRMMNFENFQDIAYRVLERMEKKNLIELFQDDRLFQEIESMTCLSLYERVKFIDRMIIFFIQKNNRFLIMSLIRMFIRLCKRAKMHNISLNKFLLAMLSRYNDFQTTGSTIKLLLLTANSSDKEIIAPQYFPVDETLGKCFNICFQHIQRIDIFELLFKNTMFAATKTTSTIKEIFIDNLLSTNHKIPYLDILQKSLSAGEREELASLSDEPCEMVADAISSDEDLDYYLKLFPNLNLLRVGLELFIKCENDKAINILNLLQKEYNVDQYIVDRVVDSLNEHGDCYYELDYLSTFPVLRKLLKNAVDSVVDEILDGCWDWSDELCKMIEEDKDDVRLENQLYRCNEPLKFFYDMKRSFVKSEFTAKALQYTFEDSAPYAKDKARSFLQTFIDNRAEVRNIKIAHSQILPQNLKVIIYPYYSSKELNAQEDIRQELIKLRENEIFQIPEVIEGHKTIKSSFVVVKQDNYDSVNLETSLRFKLSEDQSAFYIMWKFFYVRNQLKSLIVDIV